jgi:hypothetical protein
MTTEELIVELAMFLLPAILLCLMDPSSGTRGD